MKWLLRALGLALLLSMAANAPPEHDDDQEDSEGVCFTVTLDDQAPQGFIYSEECEAEERGKHE